MQKAALPSSAGCIHRHERNRTSAADSGLSEIAGAGLLASAGAGAAACGALDGAGVSLLKLDPNGFLQRAERAQFFGSHERERASR